jgi:hypothetical protein
LISADLRSGETARAWGTDTALIILESVTASQGASDFTGPILLSPIAGTSCASSPCLLGRVGLSPHGLHGRSLKTYPKMPAVPWLDICISIAGLGLGPARGPQSSAGPMSFLHSSQKNSPASNSLGRRAFSLGIHARLSREKILTRNSSFAAVLDVLQPLS